MWNSQTWIPSCFKLTFDINVSLIQQKKIVILNGCIKSAKYIIFKLKQ